MLDERQAHHNFPIARVAEIYKGPDGVVRSVQLNLPSKHKVTKKKNSQHENELKTRLYYAANKGKTIHRGVEKIALLEANPAVSNQEPEKNHDEDNTSNGNNGTRSFSNNGGPRC